MTDWEDGPTTAGFPKVGFADGGPGKSACETEHLRGKPIEIADHAGCADQILEACPPTDDGSVFPASLVQAGVVS